MYTILQMHSIYTINVIKQILTYTEIAMLCSLTIKNVGNLWIHVHTLETVAFLDLLLNPQAMSHRLVFQTPKHAYSRETTRQILLLTAKRQTHIKSFVRILH